MYRVRNVDNRKEQTRYRVRAEGRKREERERKEEEGEKGRERERKKGREGRLGIYKTGIFLLD